MCRYSTQEAKRQEVGRMFVERKMIVILSETKIKGSD